MSPHTQRRLYAIGAFLVAGMALAYLSMSSMGDDLVYYWSPTELNERGAKAKNATVRLGGLVAPGSVDWDPENQTLAFTITDGVGEVSVVGKGAPPQMFREGIGVVVEGKLGSDDKFHTTTVMVKHSNEYRAPEEGERPEDVYKSLVVEDAS